jgi:hypothetical protein
VYMLAAGVRHRAGQDRLAVERAALEKPALMKSTRPIGDRAFPVPFRFAWPFFSFHEDNQLIPIMAVA